MRRYNITVGDKTTAGGVVTTGCNSARINGQPIACELDSIFCPACNSVGMICCDGPHNTEQFDGRKTALEYDLCLCKCSPPPRLIASQQFKFQTIETGAIANRSEAATASAPVPQRTSAPAAPASSQPMTPQQSALPVVANRPPLTPELIAVAGSQHDNGSGNKMMFIGQAVRELAMFKLHRPDRIRTLLVFTPTYNDNMINDARESALGYGAEFVSVRSVREFFDHLNNGKDREQSPIEHLSLFSHGVPQQVAFGYQLAEAEQMSLNVLNYTQISPAAFSRSAQIDSYACRTGMGNLPEYGIEEGVQIYPQTNESLAQLLANHTRLKVKAFIRRSDYLDTWGSRGERIFGRACGALVNAVLSNEWCKRWIPLAAERKQSNAEHDYTYQQMGAINPVTSGSTPALAKEGHHEFLPK